MRPSSWRRSARRVPFPSCSSRSLLSSGVHSPSIVRYALKSTCSRSLAEMRRPVSNQAEVWDSVARLHESHAVASRTGALGDAFVQYAAEVDPYHTRLRYVHESVVTA